jgi:hypothetical protein
MGARKIHALPARLKKAGALPAGLEKLRRRFERWRQTREIPSRIPGSLWTSAARMAGTYGISRTAKMLGVNYGALKQRVDGGAAVGGGSEDSNRATFLELAPSTRVGSCQCTLELEDASGAKMRVHLQSDEAPDLAALSRSFWSPGP